MLLLRDGHRDARWAYSDIGPALGEKHRLVKAAAERGGELGDARNKYMEKVVASAIGMSTTAWSNAKAGRVRTDRRDYVHAQQLRALAAYFHLDAGHYLGADAWLVYTPEIAPAMLEQRLLDVGYGGLSFMHGSERRPADGLLAWLRTHHAMTRLGISVSEAREFDSLGMPTRAAGVVDEAMEEEEQSTACFGPHDRIVVCVEASQGWHAVLLQLTDAPTPPYFTLRCLVPSYRQPTTELSGATVLPMLADRHGRPGFGLGADAALVDLIAIVTRDAPLPLPFEVSEQARFHVIHPGAELQRLKGALAQVPPSLRRVLHVPLRVA